MDKGYLILNQENKKVDFQNLFLDKKNAIQYLNQLNNNTFLLNLVHLKHKLNKTKKIKKRSRFNIIIEDYIKLRNDIDEAIKKGLPMYMEPTFKKIKYLKHREYYIVEIDLTKTENKEN